MNSTPTPADRDIARLLKLAQDAIEIDRTAKAQAREAMRSAYIEELRSVPGSPTDPVTQHHSELGVAELVRLTTPRRFSPRWHAIAVAAATLALVVGVAIAVSQVDGEMPLSPADTIAPVETLSPVPTTDTGDSAAAIAAAEAIGVRFVQARADHDAATLVSVLAPDASFSLTEPAQTVDEVPLQAEWERLVGWQFLDPSCTSVDPAVVMCTYTVQGAINERLGLGPYVGNSFRLEISDGRIQHVDHIFNAFEFFTDTEVQFYSWLRDNYPNDFALMLEGDRLLGGDYPSFPRLTPESIRVWEERTTEYLATLS